MRTPLALASLALIAGLVGVSAPADARPPFGHDYGRHEGWRRHEFRREEWRHEAWRRDHYRYGPRYYAPRQAYAPPPGIFIPFR